MTGSPGLAFEIANYGSDKDGLVCAYLFAPGEAGQAIDADQASVGLSAPRASGSFLWLHFNVSNTAANRWMQQHLSLPEAFHESLPEAATSTRIDQADVMIQIVRDATVRVIAVEEASSGSMSAGSRSPTTNSGSGSWSYW